MSVYLAKAGPTMPYQRAGAVIINMVKGTKRNLSTHPFITVKSVEGCG